MADCKDFLVSEVITTGSRKENWECSDLSHPSTQNTTRSIDVPWQVPAEGNEVGCSCMGHLGKPGGHVQLKGSGDENGVSFQAQFGLEGSF